MPKPRVAAKDVVKDIRSGMSDSDLMRKYRVSAKGLEKLFAKLVRAGALKQSDLDQRDLDVDSVAVAGLDTVFERRDLVSLAREELNDLKRKILLGELTAQSHVKSAFPDGIESMLDPFEWFAYAVQRGDQYVEWAMRQAEVVELTPWERLFVDDQERQRLKQRLLQARQFGQAIDVSRITNASYCEGWIITSLFQNLPIKHAWNSVSGSYFDVQLEIAREARNDPPSPIYILAHQINSAETIEISKEFAEELSGIFFGELGRVYWKERIRGGS